MPRSFALALALLFSSATTAQVSLETVRAYLPLDVGNVWEYDFHRQDCDHWVYGGECRTMDTTFTYRVVAHEVRGMDTLAVIDGPGSQTRFGVRADGSDWVSETVYDDDGVGWPLPPFPHISEFRAMERRDPISWTFDVSGTSYTREAMAYYPPAYVLVRNLGLTEHSRSYQATGGQRWNYSWRLTGATVRGINYGGFATAAETPTAAGTLEWSLGPNPTAGRLTVRAALGRPAQVRVEVVDVLGRTVRTVDTRSVGDRLATTVDVEGVPPGTYLVRLVLDGRAVATQAVTRVR